MNKILKYEIFSLVFVSIFGVLLHFLYDWSNYSLLVSLFSAVNESVWEHLKLLFFPSIFTWFLALLLGFKEGNYLSIKLNSIILGMIFIITFFYTYTGIIGTHYALLDIGSFFIAAIISFIYTIKHYNQNKNNNEYLNYFIIFIITLSFIVFTFKPLRINLFYDFTQDIYGKTVTKKAR